MKLGVGVFFSPASPLEQRSAVPVLQQTVSNRTFATPAVSLANNSTETLFG